VAAPARLSWQAQPPGGLGRRRRGLYHPRGLVARRGPSERGRGGAFPARGTPQNTIDAKSSQCEAGGMDKINRVARVLSSVASEPTPRGCLLWTSCSNNRGGYGIANIYRSKVLTHRLAWAFGLFGERHGAMPPSHVVIRHSCDVPSCCNPEHLQAGTQAENMRDAAERGRLARGDAHYSRKHPERLARGEANPSAKLTDAAVAKVFSLRAEGLKQREIATLVGCSRQHVSRILRGLMRAQQNTL
jgi:hypothetical protein